MIVHRLKKSQVDVRLSTGRGGCFDCTCGRTELDEGQGASLEHRQRTAPLTSSSASCTEATPGCMPIETSGEICAHFVSDVYLFPVHKLLDEESRSGTCKYVRATIVRVNYVFHQRCGRLLTESNLIPIEWSDRLGTNRTHSCFNNVSTLHTGLYIVYNGCFSTCDPHRMKTKQSAT